MKYYRGFYSKPDSGYSLRTLSTTVLTYLAVIFFILLENSIREYDTILCVILWIVLIIWIIVLIVNTKKRKVKIRDIIYFDPPKYYTAAEVAVIDQRGPTWRVFPAMLYERITNKNVKLWMDRNWELYFEKLKETPMLEFDASFLMSGYDAYNKDPEHDFWSLCFPNRSRVYLKMINRLPDLGKLPSDFFYKVQRDCTRRYDYKHERRNLRNIDNEIYILTSVALFLFFFSILLVWWFPLMLALACVVRIISLKIDFKLWSKEYINQAGIDVIEQVKGFKKYLLAVDDAKLKVVLQEDPLYFEKTLPYAIALGVGDSWAVKCFKHVQFDKFWDIISEKLYNDTKLLHHTFDWLDDLPTFIKFLNHYYKRKEEWDNAHKERKKTSNEKTMEFIDSMNEVKRKKRMYTKFGVV